jgi:site-specific recombinase XerD
MNWGEGVALAVVRTLRSPRRLATAHEVTDFEQELVDQFALAMVGAGNTDEHVSQHRATLFEFARFVGRPVWTAAADDADRYLAHLRKNRGLAHGTLDARGRQVGRFFEYLLARHQGDIHELTGHVLVQPIDEFNRPGKSDHIATRIPPSTAEVDLVFTRWREALPEARKFLPAARDYFAASLWRRAGLRIGETVQLDIGDWRPDLGEHGKLHVRFGKGSRRRGPKPRLVPGINSVDALMDWWLGDIRHQFDDRWGDPGAPLLPSERYDRELDRCTRAGDDALRSGLAAAVEAWLPAWTGRLTPHALRHFCASSMYEQGMDLKAIQDLLGHEWLSTTTRYIHVHDAHIERAWAAANSRVAERLSQNKG